MKCNNIYFSVLIVIVGTAVAVDYCSKEICTKHEGKHIACDNNGDFGPSCPSERRIASMTNELLRLLLQKHNTARMNIANGKVKGFSSANRMIEMSWDNELEAFTVMNAKSCIFGLDQCRNTAVFKHAGQNIAITQSSPHYTDTESAINDLFDLWYNEYVNCNMTQIEKLSSINTTKGFVFGHFTQIVMANLSKLGCAIVNYLQLLWKATYLVCNYSQTNMISWPVYTTGSPCSGCKSGCSRNYPGLCNVNEVI